MTVDAEKINAVLDDLMQPPRIPRATYRLQFNADFTFQDALALVPYLDALGISDVYASPLFKPRTGSQHGYDVVDYSQFNPALGTADDFDALVAALKERGMGLFLDIVPNHMGASTENAWWIDVLKQGQSSEYAHYFDIDWQPHNRAMDDKVLLPILGNHYGQVLEAGELKVVYWHGDFYVHYYEHQLPMTPETYRVILNKTLELLPDQLDEADAWVPIELASVIRSLDYLPSYQDNTSEQVVIRRQEETIIRWRLLGLFDKSEVFRTTMQAALDIVNGTVNEPDTFDTLDNMLSEQPYRLAYWRVATDEINYRRFFDINDLAALRIEDADVFADVHRYTFRLLIEGKVSGLRIDHPDGLWDPEGYFWRLQTEYLAAALRDRIGDDADYSEQIVTQLEALRGSSTQRAEWPLYVLIEKILSESEPLPNSWAVYGTTGYDFMYAVNNLFVDPANETAFNQLYADFISEEIIPHQLTDFTKKLVMSKSLTSELESRSTDLVRIVERNRRYRGFTQNSLSFALREIIAALDIYRTYIIAPGMVSERDQKYLHEAVDVAKKRNPLVPSSLFEFLRETLLMKNLNEFAEEQRSDLRQFVVKFQQITGPVMAKSVEDTAFYIYNRLVSLNEVGGHMSRFGATVSEFHAHNTEQAYPYTMLSSSTHDTKRSEDVRARINVLSEMPETWRSMIERWVAINVDYKTEVADQPAPSRNDEYLIYQTLVGAYHPAVDDDKDFCQRIIVYMHKAINEAKIHSNWINPNEAYAQAISDFVTSIWEGIAFRESFDQFLAQIAHFGRLNSLSQTLLKLTAPGVPDIYQGNELWNYSLVDPDNRRPINFHRRQAILDEIHEAGQGNREEFASNLLANAESGVIKLYLTYRVLNLRAEHESLFQENKYLAVNVEGMFAKHVCAFMRVEADGKTMLVVTSRLVATMLDNQLDMPIGEIWGDTELVLPTLTDGQQMENILTGEIIVSQVRLRLSQVLRSLPVAVLFYDKTE